MDYNDKKYNNMYILHFPNVIEFHELYYTIDDVIRNNYSCTKHIGIFITHFYIHTFITINLNS